MYHFVKQVLKIYLKIENSSQWSDKKNAMKTHGFVQQVLQNVLLHLGRGPNAVLHHLRGGRGDLA